MKPIIAGIDPGTTTAYAVIDFDFKVLKVISRKNFPLSDLIKGIYQEGNPILVGTDKKNLPCLIKEFSQKTGASPICPSYDTKKGEKKRMVQNAGFGDFVSNAHETDALASAIIAFEDFRPLLKKIKSFVERAGKEHLREDIIYLAITKNMSIRAAVELLEKEPEKIIIKKKKKLLVSQPKKISKEVREIKLLRVVVKKLRKEIKCLKSELAKERNKKIDIDEETKKLLSFKEKKILFFEKQMTVFARELMDKQDKIEKLNEFLADAHPEKIILKRLQDLSLEEFFNKKETLRIRKGDVLMIKDIKVIGRTVLRELEKLGVTIIHEKGSNTTLEKKFVLVKRDELNIKEAEHFAMVSRQDLMEAVKRQSYKKELLHSIIEEYRRERA